MRTRLVLLALLLIPTGLSQSVDLVIQAPEAVPADGTPFDVDVSLDPLPEGPVELKLWLGNGSRQASRTWNGTAWQRSDHYLAQPLEGTPGQAWQATVGLRANPASANAEALLSSVDARVHAKARYPGGHSQARWPVSLVHEPEHVTVPVPPGASLESRDAGGHLLQARTNPYDHLTLLTVGLAPGRWASLCLAERCRPHQALGLAAVAEEVAVIEHRGHGSVDLAGSHLATPAGACPLTGHLVPGQHLIVAWETPVAVVPDQPCQPTGPGSDGDVVLHDLGRVLDQRVPPARGWAVRDPVHNRTWSPFPLPTGTWPEPFDLLPVSGWSKPLSTRQAGLATVQALIDGARHRLTVATYLFTHEAVADGLEAAAARGVDVSLIIEEQPVGGPPPAQARIVQHLAEAGVEVSFGHGSWRARGLQHAKVIVADGHVALVMTENLTGSGLPSAGGGNIGLGFAVANTSLARRLEAVFGEQGPSHPWHPPGWQPFEGAIGVLTTPESTWRPSIVPALVRASRGPIDGMVLTASPRWHGQANPWMEALVEASQSNRVRVLANGVAYEDQVSHGNRPALAFLAAHPEAGQLEARASLPAQGRVHAKALMGPGWSLIGSSNWGPGGALYNREVNLLIVDPTTAAFYRHTFEEIWRTGWSPIDPVTMPPPLVVAGLTLAAGGLAGWCRRST